MKVIPIPFNDVRVFAIWSFSRMAAIMAMASHQPIPEPKNIDDVRDKGVVPSDGKEACSEDSAVYSDEREVDAKRVIEAWRGLLEGQFP
jgi:hypothetical protein